MMRIDRWVSILLILSLVAGCGRTPPQFVERPPLQGHSREVTSLAFAPDGRSLASRSSGEIRLWDPTKDSQIAALPALFSDFGSVAFSPKGNWLVSESRDSVTVWYTRVADFPSRPLRRSNFLALTEGSKGWGLAFSADGRYLVRGQSRGDSEGYLSVWRLQMPHADRETIVDSPTLPRPFTSVSISPDSQTVASGSMDGEIQLWPLDSSPLISRLTINAHRSYLAPVLFTPDGNFVVSANEDRSVRFWFASTGEPNRYFKGHLKAILSIAFHPDGRTMVSGDAGGTIFVWDVPTQKVLTRLESKERGKVWALAFSPDGKILASGGEDKMIHLWDYSDPRR